MQTSTDVVSATQPLLNPRRVEVPRRLDEPDENSMFKIPMWDDLSRIYESKWLEKKEEFQNQLKENFRAMVSQFRSGKQVIFELTDHTYSKHYEQAFRELFADTGYQATIGDIERLGSGHKKSKKLYITLPNCYTS